MKALLFLYPGAGVTPALFGLFIFFNSFVYASDAPKNWNEVAMRLEAALTAALKTYEGGDALKAMEEVSDAYFAVFEGEANMEIAIRRSISLKRATSIEKMFSEVRKKMNSKVPFKEVKKAVSGLVRELKDTGGELDGKKVGMDTGY